MNEKFSIFSLTEHESDLEEIPAFYQDLNLTRILDRVSAKWGRRVRDFYRQLSADLNEEEYRRAVYSDIKKESVYEALIRFTENIGQVHELREQKERATYPMQKNVWHIREVAAYCDAYEKLEKNLLNASLSSEGMQEFMGILHEILEREYVKLHEQTEQLFKEIRDLRFILTYDKDRIGVALGRVPGEGAYEEMMKERSGLEIRHFRNPFIGEPRLTELEHACLEIVEKKN